LTQHSAAYLRSKDKTNNDFAQMINAYWGRDVVRVETYQAGVTPKTQQPIYLDRIVSDVGPWPNGFPPNG
jgi:hypothetical protein